MRVFSLLVLASLLVGGGASAWGQTAPASRSSVDGITITVIGRATDPDRFVLVLTPRPRSGDVMFRVSDYDPVRKKIAAALAPFGLKPTGALNVPGGGIDRPEQVNLLLPGKFDGKKMGSGSLAEIMKAATEAGATPDGYLVSVYSEGRLDRARRDAIADAVRVGRVQATEIASLVRRRAGRVEGVVVESSAWFEPIVVRPIVAARFSGEKFTPNSLAVTLRYAMR